MARVRRPVLTRERTGNLLIPAAEFGQSQDAGGLPAARLCGFRADVPVFYMHDGQNLFDPETAYAGNEWQIDETLDQLYASYANDGFIVVGIYNGEADRWDEYSPWQITNLTNWCSWAGETVAGGEGDLYAQDLAEAVKPYIDAHYRTKPQKEYTAIGGSSMGGFISLYIGLNYQHLFSKIMAMSTAVWFDESSLLAHINSVTISNHMKIYLDVGTLESSDDANPDFPAIYRQGTETLYATFIDKGVAPGMLRLVIGTNASHTESAWRNRFPGAVTWLYQ
jgi:predicted alpha/beta superfamily hydrolase